MRKYTKRLTALLMSLILLLALCACGGDDSAGSGEETISLDELRRSLTGLTQNDFQLALQGNLDEIYIGEVDDKYLNLVDTTAEESYIAYEESMAYEAEYFCYYFDVEYPTEEYMSELVELYKEIYSHSKYEVGVASALDETTYVIKLTVSPINIMELAVAEMENGAMDAFWEKYPEEKINAMSEAEYEAFDQEWAQLVLDVVKGQMPNIGYQEDTTLAVQFILEDDIWMIDENDLQNIDSYIIAYP